MGEAEVVALYERIMSAAIERAYEAGYQRGYVAGRLDAEIKESADITPSPSYPQPQSLRA